MRHNLLKKAFLVSFLLTISGCTTNYVIPYVEIADPNHEEIASVRRHYHEGYLVAYNPNTCKATGEACGFFRSHAYAHYVLGHSLMRPKYYPPISEYQADCYVAKHAKPNQIRAMVKLLLDENRDPNLKIHGDPIARAQNITDCAKGAGNWNIH